MLVKPSILYGYCGVQEKGGDFIQADHLPDFGRISAHLPAIPVQDNGRFLQLPVQVDAVVGIYKIYASGNKENEGDQDKESQQSSDFSRAQKYQTSQCRPVFSIPKSGKDIKGTRRFFPML
jgi:hypothetical protein